MIYILQILWGYSWISDHEQLKLVQFSALSLVVASTAFMKEDLKKINHKGVR